MGLIGVLGSIAGAQHSSGQAIDPSWRDAGLGLKLAQELVVVVPPQTAKAPVMSGDSRRWAATGLLQVATQALANQPLLRTAAARVTVDAERVEQARGVMRPSASGNFTYQREYERSGTTLPYRSDVRGLQATLPLYRPQASAGIDVAQFQFESTGALRIEAESDLLSAVANNYFLAAQQSLETRSLTVEHKLLMNQRQLNERRMQGGIGTLVEVLETSARADLLMGQVRGSAGAEKNLLAELARLAVTPVAAVYTMRDESPLLIVPNGAMQAFESARGGNATLRKFRKVLDAARANIGAQQGGNLPTVDLVANVDRTRFQFDATTVQTPSTGLGVQVNVPLFAGGTTRSRVREARAQVEIAEEELKGAENTLRSDLAKAYADLETAQSQYSANTTGLGIAQAALDATVKAFRAGARSNIDVLNAQQQTFFGERELSRSRVAIQLAQVRILALTGTLNLDTITRLARSLEEKNK